MIHFRTLYSKLEDKQCLTIIGTEGWWRIGNSPIAPKFNIVAKPNEWTKGGIREELTPAKQLQLEFWTAFREYVLNQGSVIKPTKALPQYWMNISIGRSYFGMYSFVDTTKPRMGVRLFIAGLDAKAHFELLRQQRVDIEKEIGEELSWEKKPSKKESSVGLYDTTRNCQDREQWPDAYSGPNRPLIPIESGHLFRGKPVGDSGAK